MIKGKSGCGSSKTLIKIRLSKESPGRMEQSIVVVLLKVQNGNKTI